MEFIIAYFLFNGLLVFAHYADNNDITIKQSLVLALFAPFMIIIGAVKKLRDRRQADGQ